MPTFAELAGFAPVAADVLPEPTENGTSAKIVWASQVFAASQDQTTLRRAEDVALRALLDTQSTERDFVIQSFVSEKLAARLVSIVSRSVLHRVGCALLRATKTPLFVTNTPQPPDELSLAATHRVATQQASVSFATETLHRLVKTNAILYLAENEPDALRAVILRTIGSTNLTDPQTVIPPGFNVVLDAARALTALRPISIAEQQVLIDSVNSRHSSLITTEGWLFYLANNTDHLNSHTWAVVIDLLYKSFGKDTVSATTVVNDLMLRYKDAILVSADNRARHRSNPRNPWSVIGKVGDGATIDGPLQVIAKTGSIAVFEWALDFWRETNTKPSTEAVRETLAQHPNMLGLLLTIPPDQQSLDIVSQGTSRQGFELPLPEELNTSAGWSWVWGVCRPDRDHSAMLPAAQLLNALPVANDRVLAWLLTTHKCLAAKWLNGDFAANLPTPRQAVFMVKLKACTLNVYVLSEILDRGSSAAIKSAVINCPELAYYVRHNARECSKALLEMTMDYLRYKLPDSPQAWYRLETVLETTPGAVTMSLQDLASTVLAYQPTPA